MLLNLSAQRASLWLHDVIVFSDSYPGYLSFSTALVSAMRSCHRTCSSVGCVIYFQRMAWCWLKTIYWRSSLNRHPRVHSSCKSAVLVLILSIIGKAPVHTMTRFVSKAASFLYRFALAKRHHIAAWSAGRRLVLVSQWDAIILFLYNFPLVMGETMTTSPCWTELCIVLPRGIVRVLYLSGPTFFGQNQYYYYYM